MCLYMSPWHCGGNGGALSSGDELEKKIDQRNRWMPELFLAWTRFRDEQQASWGSLKRACETVANKNMIRIVNQTGGTFFFNCCSSGTSATCISSLFFFIMSIDIKAKRYSVPWVVQGRYVADEPWTFGILTSRTLWLGPGEKKF